MNVNGFEECSKKVVATPCLLFKGQWNPSRNRLPRSDLPLAFSAGEYGRPNSSWFLGYPTIF